MPEKANTLKMVAVGEFSPSEESHTIFDPIRTILQEADIAGGAMQTLLTNKGTRQINEGPALNRRPGTPPPVPSLNFSHGDPNKRLDVIADAGFNLVSFASPHAYSRSDEGLIDTMAALKSKNIACIGAGKDIVEATKPAIWEKKGQKIGFLAYCSAVPPGAWATDRKGGVAPLRASTSYEQIDWQPGSPPRTTSWCNKDDIAGMVDDIQKLKSQVDVVVVSMVWGLRFVPGLIADFQFEAGHAAIDAGADLIMGHHGHALKGIEVYKGKTIFYGLGNICIHSPAPFQANKASGLYWIKRFGNRYEVDMDHPTYPFPVNSQKTILVKCAIADKKIQRVAYLPLWFNVRNQPEVVSHSDKRSDAHFRYIQWLCGSQGLDTHLVQDGDEVVIKP